jgi:hypothetical protein
MRQALAKIKNKAVGPTHRYVIGPSDNETYSSRKTIVMELLKQETSTFILLLGL